MNTDDFTKVMAAVEPLIDTKKKEYQSGIIDCPVCGNNLAWSYGGPRAMMVKCATPTCVRFMS